MRNGFASILLALATGCSGYLFSTRTEVVGFPRVAATARVEVSAEATPPEASVVVAAPALPGFELEGVAARASEGTSLGVLDGFASAPRTNPAQAVSIETSTAESSPAQAASVETSTAQAAQAVSSTSTPPTTDESGVRITLESRASVPRAGVWSPSGRPASLGALVGGGVQVDGVLVRFGDLAGLAALDLGAPGAGRLATDGAIEGSAELEHEVVPAGGETHVIVRARAPAGTPGDRGRLRVHLVLDASSSMQRSWPDMLAAARRVVAELRPTDELHLVAYGSDVSVALPAGAVGDGRRARAALDAIRVGGGTHIEAGLRAAYRAAQPGDLVILFSDGVPNHGMLEPGELGALARTAARGRVTTCAVGLGTDFDPRTLRRISGDGGGAYHVSADLDTLGAYLVAQLETHGRVLAREVRVRVALGAGVELVGFADGDAGAHAVPGGVELALPSLAPGQERRLVLRVRVPAQARAFDVAQVELGYLGLRGPVRAETSLRASVGPSAVARAGAASPLLDADLAATLDAVAAAASDGDGGAARRALETHAALLEGRVEHGAHPRLQARARITRRLAHASAELIPSASHAERRRFALELGELAVGLGR
ncbi:MAG: VWA domain-containing protein [Sandaracinaceae bacterium]|nr:VWA domain-containing protein [Sandaracinaceae bacterium]